MDNEGYPLDETLQQIERWEIKDATDCEALLGFIGTVWWAADWGWTREARRQRDWKGGPLHRRYRISTDGWSGNESIITAMMNNWMFWALAWWSSHRGGHYEFRV